MEQWTKVGKTETEEWFTNFSFIPVAFEVTIRLEMWDGSYIKVVVEDTRVVEFSEKENKELLNIGII
jgi:hypothetical protein